MLYIEIEPIKKMLCNEIEIYMETLVMLGLGEHEPHSWLAVAFPCL